MREKDLENGEAEKSEKEDVEKQEVKIADERENRYTWRGLATKYRDRLADWISSERLKIKTNVKVAKH